MIGPALLLETAGAIRGEVRVVMRSAATGEMLVTLFRNGSPAMVFAPGDGRTLGDLLVRGGLIDRQELDMLASERAREECPLHQLVVERTGVPADRIQALLDFQARERLLDALVWTDGTFRIEPCASLSPDRFSLSLPPIASLSVRALERARQLPGLLARLPAPPQATLIRRRRGVKAPLRSLARMVFEQVAEPLTLSSLAARILVDDDILIDAVLSLAEGGLIKLEASARLVAGETVESALDLRHEELVREILVSLRGEDAARGPMTMWLVVAGDDYRESCRLIDRLASNGHGQEADPLPLARGVERAALSVAPGVTVCLYAVNPDVLNNDVRAGIMARCDGLLLLQGGRGGGDPRRGRGGFARLTSFVGRRGTRPPVLGVHPRGVEAEWPLEPDAVLALSEDEMQAPKELLVDLLLGTLAASRATVTDARE